MGYKHNPETRAKISTAMKGHKTTVECRTKISLSKKGRNRTAEEGHRISFGMLGHKISPETKSKISAARKGYKISKERRAPMSAISKNISEETREKMSVASKGRRPSEETKAKLSAIGSLRIGPKNPRWMGGISMLPYSWAFTDELKAEVRRRDGHKCQLCGVPQMECKSLLCTHHIDYDKNNSDPVNLITLCRACHARTNSSRNYWKTRFQGI